MQKFFLAQSAIVLLLVYIQMYVQEGTFQVGYKTFESFIVIFSFSLAISVILAGIRKVINRTTNFPENVIKFSIFILPVYYVMQLLGWLHDTGIVGGN